EELRSVNDVIDKLTVHWESRPQPKTTDEIAGQFDAHGQALARKLDTIDDGRWESTARFLAGGKEVFSASVGTMSWWILFDLIHHRGQLTAYLRPMGGKVPAVYGPSADSA